MSRAHHVVRRVGRLAVIALAAALAACADASTTPPPPHGAPRAAARDDPPDQPCFTGWVVVNGIWTCSG